MQLKEEFRQSMLRLLGEAQGNALIDALQLPASTSVRINPHKSSLTDPLEGYDKDGAVAWCKTGAYLASRPSFSLNPLLHAGCFYVQDASSMVYDRLATIATDFLTDKGIRISTSSPLKVLDLCAAPGGKTTAMLGSLPDDTVMCSNEYVAQRASILKENILKWGAPDCIVTNSPANRFSTLECFDIVAVDAPCSGEGMMRKEEIAVTQWSEGLIEQCARLQREILDNAIGALKPGGILIYSTCTFNDTENEKNVQYLIERHGLTPIPTGLEGLEGILPALDPATRGLRFMPHSTRGEGLFAAMLTKPGDITSTFTPALPTTSPKKKKGKEKGSDIIPREATDMMARLLLNPGKYRFISHGEYITAMTPEGARLADTLTAAGVKIIQAGTPTAELKGGKYVAHPLLPLGTIFRQGSMPGTELTTDDALRFLRRDAITLPADTPKGLVTVTYHGVPLGMVKNIGTRANNLWPAPWKLRSAVLDPLS